MSIHSEPDMIPFSKDPSGRYIVLYTFIARDENDVSVERGEFVTGGYSQFFKVSVKIQFTFSVEQRRSRLVLDSKK